jgi:signal transduction histidine kinase
MAGQGSISRKVSRQLRRYKLEDVRRGLVTLVEALRTGRHEGLLELCLQPLESARLVRAMVDAALPIVLKEPEALPLIEKLVGMAATTSLAVAEDSQNGLVRLVAHELRRPVTTIRGYLAIIQEDGFGPVSEALRRPLQQIAACNQEVVRLLDGLTAMARLEDSDNAVPPASLALLVKDAIDMVQAEAEIRRVQIKRQIDSHLSAVVDGMRITIALVNLLSNALKYSPLDSRVDVRLRRENREAVISVEDQGPGVEPGEEERVFEPYYRSDGSRAAGIPGTGLGLYFVRQIAEMYAGRVAVESRPGGGATFSLWLPLSGVNS